MAFKITKKSFFVKIEVCGKNAQFSNISENTKENLINFPDKFYSKKWNKKFKKSFFCSTARRLDSFPMSVPLCPAQVRILLQNISSSQPSVSIILVTKLKKCSHTVHFQADFSIWIGEPSMFGCKVRLSYIQL